jgi:3-methylcrotonyl-CoA carboxylase alpha subunit
VFKKILIANRGEIACRIARTCRRLGVSVAGVHSRADADSLHVKTIGESLEIGGAPATESYLRIDAVIAAARATGAQAIHSGFGFLAENAAFARAVEAAGLVFIGPRPETIERLGDKALAKKEAERAGVPIVPGSSAPSQDTSEIAATVLKIGFPAMLKAAAGGGGKGMRALVSQTGLDEDIASAMREAKNTFGSAGLIVEKLLQRGRHIEVQIAGDGTGNVIHLFERECSLQRRHQKLIEEAPAINLSAVMRERILDNALRLGRQLNYRGVGTVEFIVSGEAYYFLEVNPRLQVEHPVTEEVTGIDIVELMLRIACGEGLPVGQHDIVCRGHAVEARLCAEDPAHNFLPSTGTLSLVRFPNAGVRVESGVETGSVVTSYYDSMLAKLIALGKTREAALDRLDAALGETSIFGVTTNQNFLRQLIALPETRKADFYTRLIDDRLSELLGAALAPQAEAFALAACHWLMGRRDAASADLWHWRAMTGWQMGSGDEGLSPIPILHLEVQGATAEIRFSPQRSDGTTLIAVDEQHVTVGLERLGEEDHLAILNGRRVTARLQQDGEMFYVQWGGGIHAFRAIPYLAYISAAVESSGEIRSPMMGMMTRVNVVVGDAVKVGDVVAVMESMKMELRIASKMDGVVVAVNCRTGDMVERNAVVIAIEARPPAGGKQACDWAASATKSGTALRS